MANILFVVPVALGLPRVEFCMSLMGSVLALARAGHNTGFMMDESGSIVRSRNLGAAQLLNNPEYTHLAFADADMSWQPHDVFVKMIELDRPVVCGVYLTKWGQSRWTMHTKCQNPRDVQPTEQGLVPLLDAPTGLMLIKREVFVEMAEKRPDLKINFDSVVEHPDHPDGLFEPGTYLFFDARRSTRGKKGHYISDDYGFSENYESIGGEIVAYPWVTVAHHYTTSNVGCLGTWLEEIGVKGLKKPAEEGGA